MSWRQNRSGVYFPPANQDLADIWAERIFIRISFILWVFLHSKTPGGHFYSAVIIMRDIMRGDYARGYARYYARLNLTVTTDVCSIGWLSRAMMCVDKGGAVGQA